MIFFSEKTGEDKDRETWLVDQWVNLTEEKNFVLHPEAGSSVPGSPSSRLEGNVDLCKHLQ